MAGAGGQEALLGQVRLEVKRSEAALAELATVRAERDDLLKVISEGQCVARSEKQALVEELRLSDEQLATATLAMSEEQRGAATLTRLLIACQVRLAELENVFGTLSAHSSAPAVVLNHVASLKLHSLPGAGREERTRRLAAVDARLDTQLQGTQLSAHPLFGMGPGSPSAASLLSSRGGLSGAIAQANSPGGGSGEVRRATIERAGASRAAVAGVSSAGLLRGSSSLGSLSPAKSASSLPGRDGATANRAHRPMASGMKSAPEPTEAAEEAGAEAEAEAEQAEEGVAAAAAALLAARAWLLAARGMASNDARATMHSLLAAVVRAGRRQSSSPNPKLSPRAPIRTRTLTLTLITLTLTVTLNPNPNPNP